MEIHKVGTERRQNVPKLDGDCLLQRITTKRGLRGSAAWPEAAGRPLEASFHCKSIAKDSLHRVWGRFAYVLFHTFWVSTKFIEILVLLMNKNSKFSTKKSVFNAFLIIFN